jgi:hypothetical protein
MDNEAKGEIDAIITIALKIAEIYMNWFMWLCGVNVVTLGAFAIQAVTSPIIAIILCAVMLLADMAGVGVCVAMNFALRKYRAQIAHVAPGKDYLLSSPVISYAVMATAFMLGAAASAWAIALAFNSGITFGF